MNNGKPAYKFAIALLSLLFVSFLTSCGPTDEKQTTESSGSYPAKASLNQTVEMMTDNPDLILIDVRTPEEYADGHVASSLSIPLDELEAQIGNYVSNAEAPVAVYCRSGRRSAQAAEMLRKQGYKNVIDAGGINSFTGELTK